MTMKAGLVALLGLALIASCAGELSQWALVQTRRAAWGAPHPSPVAAQALLQGSGAQLKFSGARGSMVGEAPAAEAPPPEAALEPCMPA